MTHLERLRDERGFIHRSSIGRFVGGIASSIVSTVPVFGGIASNLITGFTGGDEAVPQATGCPPGFIPTPTGCVPRGTPRFDPRGPGGFASALGRRRQQIGARGTQGVPGRTTPIPVRTPGVSDAIMVSGGAASQNGGVPRPAVPTLAVTGQFGAGFEASIVSRELRLCPPQTVLGVDGVCYNRRDLRNSERAWPRGRRPLMTGGDVRAISIANRAATRLQKKQKQLEDMGMLKKKVCPKPKQLLPGHVAQLAHGSEH